MNSNNNSFLLKPLKPTTTYPALIIGFCSLLWRKRKTMQPLHLYFDSVASGPFFSIRLTSTSPSTCPFSSPLVLSAQPAKILPLLQAREDACFFCFLLKMSLPMSSLSRSLSFYSPLNLLQSFFWDTLSKGPAKWLANCHSQWQFRWLLSSGWVTDHFSILCFCIFQIFYNKHKESEKSLIDFFLKTSHLVPTIQCPRLVPGRHVRITPHWQVADPLA